MLREPAPKGHKSTKTSEGSIHRPVVANITDYHLKQGVSEQLNRLNHPSTPQSVSADHSSVLEGVKVFGGEVLNDSREYIGTTFEEMGGAGGHMHVGNRGAEGEKVIAIARERARKKDQNQEELEKAA